MTRIPWDRCDAVGCKESPIALIEMEGMKSIISENQYIAQVRVCRSHYDKQIKAPNFLRIVKKRQGVRFNN